MWLHLVLRLCAYTCTAHENSSIQESHHTCVFLCQLGSGLLKSWVSRFQPLSYSSALDTHMRLILLNSLLSVINQLNSLMWFDSWAVALVTPTLLCFGEKLSGSLLSLKEVTAASLTFCLGNRAPSAPCVQETCSWGQRVCAKVGVTAGVTWTFLQEKGCAVLPSPVQNTQTSAVKSALSSSDAFATAEKGLMLSW